MNNQEIFDAVCEHLIKQGRPAMRKGCCAYRGDNGTRCAVGFLIEDDEYRDIFEGKTVDELVAKFAAFDVKDEETVALLCSLQYAHDMAEWPEGTANAWTRTCKQYLRRTAKKTQSCDAGYH